MLRLTFFAVAPCAACTLPYVECALTDGLCADCLDARSRTLALAAESIPPRLLGLTLLFVREASALAVTQAEIRRDAPDAAVAGLDDGDLPFAHDRTLDDTDLPLLAHAVCDGGVPTNSAVDPGEAA